MVLTKETDTRLHRLLQAVEGRKATFKTDQLAMVLGGVGRLTLEGIASSAILLLQDIAGELKELETKKEEDKNETHS